MMTTTHRQNTRRRPILATIAATAALAIGAAVAGPAIEASAVPAVTTANAVRATTTQSSLHTVTTKVVTVSAPSVMPAASTMAAANWWDKTAAFVGCIFGVGVPIGLAWSVATNPAWLAFFLGRGPLPASAGGAAYNYWNWIRSTCAYALF